jgi:hypothetical protein
VELEAAPEFDKHLVMNRCLGREVVAIAVAIAGGLSVDRAVYFWMARLALEQALKGSLCRLKDTRLRNVDAMPLPIHAEPLNNRPNIGCFFIVCGIGAAECAVIFLDAFYSVPHSS